MAQETDLRWWKYSGVELASSIHSTIVQLSTVQSYRRLDYWRYARMYGNSVAGLGSSVLRTGFSGGSNRLALNVIKNMSNAATAKVTKTRPKPMFLTNGGDYMEQKKAKQLTKFVEGQFYESNLYGLAPTIFLDACIYGTGCMKIFTEEESIKCERVFPWELLVDEVDGRDGRPRQIYQIAKMDRLVLCELYPDKVNEIMVAPQSSFYMDELQTNGIINCLSNMIMVQEAWHLPSGKNAKDGKHVIAVEGSVLFEEEYTKDYFPFAFVKWTDAPMGFWGIGLAEDLTGIQYEINVLLRNIQESHHLLGKGHWMVENGSKVLSTHLDNQIGSITKYSGIAPQVYAPQVVSPEIYRHLSQLYEWAYEIVGISQLSAQSQKPAGLDSGIALRTFADIQTERFVVVSRDYEDFFLETAKQMIELAREMSEENPEYAVRVESGKWVEKIRWSDVNLKTEEYVMKSYPVNALSDDPASKMQQVQDMMSAGLIAPDEGLRLLDFPDIQSQFQDMFATHELMMNWIEDMIDEGEYNPPEPLMDLDLSIRLTQGAYVYYRRLKVPQDNLDLLQRFISDAMALQAPPPAPPAPPGMLGAPDAGAPPGMPAMPPGMPMAPPGPPPTPMVS